MKTASLFYITDLTVNRHQYTDYHFCRGNTAKLKSRIGLIEQGEGEFMYLNRRIPVKQGDIVFVPEKVFCYSEWHGTPEIKVTYLNFNIVGNDRESRFALQVLKADEEARELFLEAVAKLSVGEMAAGFYAYAAFYRFLARYDGLFDQTLPGLDVRLYDVIEYITTHWNEDFSVEEAAKACSISSSKLYALFREQLGQSPISYLNRIKINYALQYLEDPCLSITKISELTHFYSEGYFRKVFRSIVGMTPSDYRKIRSQI